MVPNPIKMDDLGVPLFLETPMYQKIAIQNSTTLRDFLSLDLQIQIDNIWPTLEWQKISVGVSFVQPGGFLWSLEVFPRMMEDARRQGVGSLVMIWW